MTPAKHGNAGSKRDVAGLLMLLAAGLVVFLILLSPASASALELAQFALLATLLDEEGR
jgi:hypothetical protein